MQALTHATQFAAHRSMHVSIQMSIRMSTHRSVHMSIHMPINMSAHTDWPFTHQLSIDELFVAFRCLPPTSACHATCLPKSHASTFVVVIRRSSWSWSLSSLTSPVVAVAAAAAVVALTENGNWFGRLQVYGHVHRHTHRHVHRHAHRHVHRHVHLGHAGRRHGPVETSL